MAMDKTTYHFKDIIAFRTNQPQAHVMEMFGHQPFDPNDIEKEEYVGWIKTVISDKEYLVATISPLSNFVCLINSEDIVRRVEASELTKEQREGIHEFYMAPNVYVNSGKEASWEGKSIDEKCCHIARKAMNALFPDDKIVTVSFTESDFIKEKTINDLYWSLDNFAIAKSEEHKQELRKKADEFAAWFRTLRFKEYYSVTVGVRGDGPLPEYMTEMNKQIAEDIGCDMSAFENSHITNMYLVAIDKNFEEVSIMRDRKERSAFFLSLGPEYDLLWNAKIGFAQECAFG